MRENKTSRNTNIGQHFFGRKSKCGAMSKDLKVHIYPKQIVAFSMQFFFRSVWFVLKHFRIRNSIQSVISYIAYIYLYIVYVYIRYIRYFCHFVNAITIIIIVINIIMLWFTFYFVGSLSKVSFLFQLCIFAFHWVKMSFVTFTLIPLTGFYVSFSQFVV